MIERKDIEKLAELSRIKLSEGEIASFQKEIDGILGYVAQIQKVSAEGEVAVSVPRSHNTFRNDIEVTEGGTYTEALLKAAPDREGNYVKVKNIF